MNYLIDYDTRKVECKSADREVLEKYVRDNDLEMAVAIISDEDDFLMEMSMDEMGELFNNLSDRERKFETEEEAAELCWSLLQSHSDDFPNYTKPVGKKLLKAGEKRSKDTKREPEGKAKPAAKPASKSVSSGDSKPAPVKRKRKKSYIGSTFTVGLEEPMKGRHTRMVNFIDENMGEATGEELESFLEAEGTTPAEHISFAIRKGYIVETEDV